jgi:hypothetical protein
MTVFQRMMIIVEQVTLGLEKMLDYLGLFGKAKTTEQKEADIAVEKAESLVYQERMKIVDAERALMQARREGNKEQMQAAAETLEAAKASKKAAESALLDAEVRKKYADDRAAGRTGVGMGGQQIRADGSPINPGDADYVPPSAPAAGGAAVPGSGGGGGTAAPAAAPAAGGKNEAEQQMRPQDLFNFLGDITGHESNYNRLDSQFRERLTAMAKEYHAVTGGKKLPFGSGARNEEENRQVGGVGSSRHLKGTAVDLSTDAVNELVKLGLLGKHGFRQNPKSAWHISDDGFAKGGIATGPKSGYNALLHGTEAVVPLPDGKTIPVNMNESAAAVDNTEMLQVLREVKASMDSMINRADNQRVVDALENSIRTQRTSNDILGKILQMSQ